MKEFKNTQKYLIMSPRKIRLVVEMVKKLNPAVAYEKLFFVPKRAAEVLAKVIKGSLTQARNAGVEDKNMIFKEIQVTQGMALKRGRAVSRGRWHGYKKRTSHITVILAEKVAAKENVKEVKKEVKEVEKVEVKKVEKKAVKKVVKKEVKKGNTK